MIKSEVQKLKKENAVLLAYIDSQIKARTNCEKCKKKWVEGFKKLKNDKR
jgi:hypothetical protein